MGRRVGGLRVLNSYWVNQDATYKYYEVILVDPNHGAIRRDPRINWIANPVHKHRELRGLTSAGKKSRGLRNKGHMAHGLRPSRRSSWKRRNAKVFVAGDCRRGQSLVVWAIRDGRDAADATRAASPTTQAEDAVVVDATHLGLAEVIDVDNILFGSEMVGAVRGIDPTTGQYFDDTKRYVDALDITGEARHAIFEGNARRVYPRLDAKLKEMGK